MGRALGQGAGVAAVLVASLVTWVPTSSAADSHSSPASAAHPRRVVYFNSDHHIYRAPATRPTHRHSLHVEDRADVYISAVSISPNGRRIAENLTYFNFTGHQHIKGCHQICDRLVVAHADGTHIRPLYTAPYGPTTPGKLAWAPDNKTLYFSLQYVQWPHTGDAHLMKVHLGRHPTPRRVPGGSGLINPSVSPSGKKLVAVRPNFDSDGFSSMSSVVKLSLATGTVSHPILHSALGPGERVVAFQDPRWSPNGKKIVVVLADPQDGPQDNERSVIDVVAADGSDHGIAHEVASGGQVYYLRDPFWRSNHEIWCARNFESFGNTDNERHTETADLFSVRVHGEQGGTIRRLTRTKTANERNPSFAR